nr:ABC transporter permease [Burkholderiaceae bacterium]
MTASAQRVANPVLALLLLTVLLSAWWPGFVSHAPNRLLGGEPVSLAASLQSAPPLLAVLVVGVPLLWATALLRRPSPGLHALVAAVSGPWLAALLGLAGTIARTLADAGAPLARTSFGAGFWLLAGAGALVLADALQRLRLPLALRIAAVAAALLPAAALLWGGALDELSLLKEYANRQQAFHQALSRHLLIVGAALLPAVLLGLPLGVAAFARPRFGKLLFATLGIVQTVPAIALFGLLIAPLAAIGLPGVGLLPAVIALLLYSLLPIVRSIAAGLAQVRAPVLEAAAAMGLTPRQRFWQVRVPIALPLLLAGLRVCCVQAIGLAMLGALIGAGGLGA